MNKEIGLSLILIGFINLVSADIGNSFWMENMMGGNCGYSGMGFGWLIGLLVAIVLILLIIWLSKQIWKNNGKRKK